MLFIHINWNSEGGMYLIPKNVQNEVLKKYGKEFYFKLPKQGTNPRGVEITNKAIKSLVTHKETQTIKINWFRNNNKKYNPYERWLELWQD